MHQHNVKTLLFAVVIFAIAVTHPLHASTDFRLGLGLPLSTVVGSQSSSFGYGPGIEFIMDIQNERESSFFLNIDYISIPGSKMDYGSGITLEPNVTDWTISGGAAYYPLRRKEGFTPVLSAETGFRFVTEEVTQNDAVAGTSQKYSNSLLFENLTLALGAEFQMDKRLSIQGKARVNRNIPLGATSKPSFIYSNQSLNYIVLQFVVSAEYRLSK